jgi:hypothetical protein
MSFAVSSLSDVKSSFPLMDKSLSRNQVSLPDRLFARKSHTLAAHLANHLAASGFVLPHHIGLNMPWSSSPPGDQGITRSEPPECEISGLAGFLICENP